MIWGDKTRGLGTQIEHGVLAHTDPILDPVFWTAAHLFGMYHMEGMPFLDFLGHDQSAPRISYLQPPRPFHRTRHPSNRLTQRHQTSSQTTFSPGSVQRAKTSNYSFGQVRTQLYKRPSQFNHPTYKKHSCVYRPSAQTTFPRPDTSLKGSNTAYATATTLTLAV